MPRMTKTKLQFVLYGISASMCVILACSRGSLDDNPDIRPYLYLATNEVSFARLLKQLPPSIVVSRKKLSIQQAIPSYPGNVYFLSNSTNRTYVSYIKIKQKGNIWSYIGTYYFDSNNSCIAVQYESWTRSLSPSVPRHILMLKAVGAGGPGGIRGTP